MNTPKVSIIVPLYNTEKYIIKCLKSLKKQTLKDIEVIIIDDGSSDNSVNIAKKHIANDDRFHLVCQNNMGASNARNRGLSLAKGEYIAFLDCDDWVTKKSMEQLYLQGKYHNADIVAGNILCFHSKEEIYPFRPVCQTAANNMPGHLYFNEVLKQNAYVMMVYNYLYKRSFLLKNGFQFENITHEDELWTPKALILAEKVVVTPFFHYFYRQRKKSIMSNHNLEVKIADIIYITDKLFSFMNETLSTTKPFILLRLLQLHNYIWSLKLREADSKLLSSTHSLLETAQNQSEDFSRYILILKRQIQSKMTYSHG